MYPAINKNIGAILILSCGFAFSAKAQVASSKPITAFYNDKINKQLAENTVSKFQSKSQERNLNLPGKNPALGEMANLKIKNPAIALHTSSHASAQEPGKLSANSTYLKQKGHPLIKPK